MKILLQYYSQYHNTKNLNVNMFSIKLHKKNIFSVSFISKIEKNPKYTKVS